MPTARSLLVIEAYRARLMDLEQGVSARIRAGWPRVFSGLTEDWAPSTARWLEQFQRTVVRVGNGYLSAYLTAETGKRAFGVEQKPDAYVGLFTDGRPLAEALRSPFVGTLGARADGAEESKALALGEQRALRMGEEAIMGTVNNLTHAAMDEDDRIEGWERATRGTCGACIGSVGVYPSGEPMRRHPNCVCVPAPSVRDFVSRRLPTAKAAFDRMSGAEQDRAFGPDVAEAVRAGEVGLTDLVRRDRIETPEGHPDNFIIRQASLDEARAVKAE